HESAARHVDVFVMQQFSFAAVGAAVWWLALSVRRRTELGATLLGFALTLLHMTMLGVLLLLSPQPLYQTVLCMWLFGLHELDDQRLGGVLMAAWGGEAYLLGGLALGWRLISPGRAAEPTE